MRLSHRALLSLCLTVLVTAWPVPSGHAAPRPGNLAPDLFMAIGRQDLDAVKSLLARGADPNARNFLQFTPLMFAAASGQGEIARMLLAAGAELNAQSPFGSALTFAAMGGHSPVAQLLLERGASMDARRPDGITVLMLAARSGQPDLIRQLLAKKADVKATDNGGASALIYAAREGKTEAARLLLGSGAAVNAADHQGWTPLTHAAAGGHADVVSLLLAKGAEANPKDRQGRTALLIAASYGDHPAAIRALLDGGADANARDSQNRSALALATARGNVRSAQVLRDRGAGPASEISDALPRTPKAAIAASLPRLQHSMGLFLKRTGCASCHHEGLARMTTGFARERGFAIDTALAQAGGRRVSDFFAVMRPSLLKALKEPEETKNVPGVDIGELVPIASFLLAGEAAHNQPPDETLSAAALILARQQAGDGSWGFELQRVPMQSSRFTMTALALRVMQAYAPKGHAAEVAQRLGRAKRWLLAAPAEATEDKAFRLLGLKWAGATAAESRKAAEELLADERPHGGWAQLPSLESDAYATGQALFALHQAGHLPVTDPLYRRGIQFLLRTQENDGSWFVSKRAIPANNYFDAGFPHGQSQYISLAATCWATMALMATVDPAELNGQAAAR